MLVTNLVVEPFPCSSQFTTSKEKKRISIRIITNAFISIFHFFFNPTFRVGPTLPLFLTSPSSHFFSPYKYSPKPLPRVLNLSLTKISSPKLSLSLELSELSWSPTTTKTPRPLNSFVAMAGKSSLATPTARSATPAASHVSSPSIAPFLSQVCLIFPFPDSIFLWTCLVFFFCE